MLIRYFNDVKISLLNNNIYSIQLNLALGPQDHTLCKNSVSVIFHQLRTQGRPRASVSVLVSEDFPGTGGRF